VQPTHLQAQSHVLPAAAHMATAGWPQANEVQWKSMGKLPSTPHIVYCNNLTPKNTFPGGMLLSLAVCGGPQSSCNFETLHMIGSSTQVKQFFSKSEGT
jgi:hypothetical protein